MERHPEVPPGHELSDRLVLSRADQVRALAHPFRTTVLGLLTERAASVAELAVATGRPKGTVAHHVGVLHRAGLVQVVRTRRVRAVEERFYGRAARTVTIAVDGHDLPTDQNDFAVAAAESLAADEQRELWSFIRHARIPPERAEEFWTRIRDLVKEFDRIPRSGDTTYGLAVGIYPVPDHPRLPPARGEGDGEDRGPVRRRGAGTG
ncbi:helix-turn-helix domain-containing protein [Oryzobacter terrae]|uniref:helix-turn-helix domain-containing protein n=1 Tax=Oryzobacter terrae TaxID=1620385 RepID=UPI003671B9D4